MFEISLHPVKDAVRQRAHLNNEDYQRLYRQSIEQPEVFWSEQARPSSSWTMTTRRAGPGPPRPSISDIRTSSTPLPRVLGGR